MDPLKNPFSPGAGAPPPELGADREEVIEAATIALYRIRLGTPEKGQMLGLRGVGKTVLLNKISELAEELGYYVVMLEVPEGQRLAQYLAPTLKSALLRLSRVEKAKDLTLPRFDLHHPTLPWCLIQQRLADDSRSPNAAVGDCRSLPSSRPCGNRPLSAVLTEVSTRWRAC